MIQVRQSLKLLLALVLTAALLFFFYGEILLHPNHYLFALNGDGFTNYFSFAYQAKYGQSIADFKGMNYPYGECLLMLDAQPLPVTLFRFFSTYIFDIQDYSIAFLNLFMIGSIMISVLFLYLIMNEFKFPWIVSVLGAVAISFLSSQSILWKFGHYALSYSCFFPISWYLYIKYLNNQGSIIYTIFILLNTLFWFYVHTYLGMIVVSFTFFAQFFVYLGNFKSKVFDQSWYIETFLQTALPVIIVLAGLSVFDHHLGRINMPYLHQYKASLYSVFLPNYSWIRPFIGQFIDLNVQDAQPWAQVGNYIGFSTLMVLIAALFYLVIKLIRFNFESCVKLLPSYGWPVLFSTIILLLFAMAIPFQYNMAYLLPEALKQFISMGRFAWAFYYVVDVFALFILLRLVKGRLGIGLAIVSSLFLLSESLGMHLMLKNNIENNKNIFSEKTAGPLPPFVYHWLNPSQYQAIIPLPFYYGYICLHTYKGSMASVELTQSLSYNTGLPTFAALTSRSSIYESQQIAQLFLPSYYTKSIQNDLKKEKILVTYTGEEITPLERELLNKCVFLFRYGIYEFYELEPKSIFNYSGIQELQDFLKHEDALVYNDISGLYSYDTLTHFTYYRNYDDLENEFSYRGKGSLQLEKNVQNEIYRSGSEQIETGIEFELSFWYYNTLFDQSFNGVWLEIQDKDDNEIRRISIDPIKSPIYDGDWAFQKINFTLEPKADHVLLNSLGANFYSNTIYFDELMIRPKQVSLFGNVDSDVILRNNENVKRY